MKKGKTAFVEMYGEILVDRGVIGDTFTHKNRSKLKREWKVMQTKGGLTLK